LALAFLLIVFLFVVILIALFAFPPSAVVRALEGSPKTKEAQKELPKETPK
jgi:Na+-transporting methylmalonyl-CoA/oxaloacetate decarboxylase gamma subunit